MSLRPLSHAQRRLLLLERLGAHADAARVARAVILAATPAPAIGRALERVVAAHPILRAEVLTDGWREAAGPTPFHHEEAEEDEGLAALRRAMAGYSLSGHPRLAAFVVTEPAKTFVGLLSHHVVANAHTLEQVVGALVHELGREVEGLREGKPWAFEAPSEEARRVAAAELASRALGSLEVPELGGDKVRPAVQTLHATPFSRPLFFAASDAARALARELDAAPESVYLAATALVLSRYLRAREVLLAYAHDGDAWGPTTRRDLARLALAPETSVRALVAAAEQERARTVDVGFEELLDRLAPPRDPSRAPITQLAFAYRARPSGDFTWTDIPTLASPFDLEVVVAESGPGAWVTVLHSDDLFDDFGRGPRFIGHLEEVLLAMRAEPSRSLASIDIVSAAERQYLALGVNPSASFPSEDTLVSRIAAQAAAKPDAVAVRFEKTSLSFAELDRDSDRVARSLATLGVGREDRVALRMERSASLIVALLGVLKAGAAYVPIEPSQPAERTAFVLEDAAPKVLIVDDEDRSQPAAGVVVRRFAELLRDASGTPEGPLASSLAYVIYTSGSTGRPKGCLIEHRHVVRLLDATAEWFSFGPDDVWTMFHSVAFDFSVWEIWAALATGGRVVVVPHLTTRSPAAFRQLVAEEGVTVLNQTPSAFRHFIDADGRAKGRLTALRTVIFGGEALELSSLRPWFERYGDSAPRLVNMYGITETTVHVTYRPLRLADLEAGYASVIGVPIPDLRVYVVDQDDHLAPIGVAGELLVGGAGVARGYHARPELTRERFVEDRYGGAGALYRSGDLAKRLPSGELDYLGRIDQQVKIRGFRIETGEIEACLRRLGLVRDVTVVPVQKGGAETALVAYVVSDKSPAELRAALRSALPEYMIPSAFVGLDDIPMTQNGKIDRRALPDAWASDQGAGEVLAEPRGDLERGIAGVFAEVLRRSVGADTHFFDAGGSSLDAVVAAERIGAHFGVEVPVIKLFEHTTVEALARWLTGVLPTDADAHAGSASVGRASPSESLLHEPIAIVGFAGRFPGADSVAELWENLLAGKDSVTRFEKAELDPSLDPAVVARPDYVAARGVLRDPELFDAAFFGMSPKEADVTDPQQRLALELSWDALESAGYDPARFDGTIGVFAGEYNVTYYTENVLRRPEVVDAVGAFAAMVGNEKDFIATRVAFKLDLRGPALSIHTACSTSLVAVAHAVNALRLGDCDMALAGGAAVTCPPRSGYVYQPGSMLSPDGFTRTFDARAEGTVFSDGAAFVVLRRLRDALRDGDRVIAVIRGAATNNDGGDKMSFTAPSAAGQAAVIKKAIANAAIDPATIGYVEAHGTATPLGDPIEIDGLARAFGAHPKPGSIAIGSLKSNVGHMVAAAGAAGLIKAALAIKEGRIPPTIHFETANPKLGLSRSAFYVADRLIEWRSAAGLPRRAGVSSFGVGGTNAHVVLEEAPPPPPTSQSRRSAQLFVLSGRSPEALGRRAADLRLAFERDGAPAADVAFTLAQGRRAFACRHFVVAADVAAAALALAKPASAISARVRPTLAFAFTGQGSQYVAMGRALSREEPVFAEALARCSSILAGWGCDLGAVLDPSEHDREAAEAKLRETSFTQPALFAVEWALHQLWRSLGVEPQLLLGHSVGEFVAACVAGVFSLEDALKLVLTRGRLMQAAPPGVMLSVRATPDEITPHISGQLGIAVVNAPKLCVVGGPESEIAALEANLAERGIATSRLRTSHAFHSPSMDGAVAPFLEVVRGVQLSPPTLPILSTVTASELTPEQATDPMYWARHLRAPVMFGPALAALWRARPDALVLEVGPRATLATLGKQISSDPRRQVAVASLDVGGSLPTSADPPEGAAFLRALGQLWAHGASVDWSAYFAGEARARVELPGYPFERRRHWVDPPRHEASAPRPRGAQTAAEQPPLATTNAATSAPSAVTAPPIAFPPTASTPKAPMTTASQDRRPAIAAAIRAVFEEASGVDLDGAPPSTSFMELGLDSLSLTQCAQLLGKRVGGGVTFRELVEELGSLELLVGRLDEVLPAEAMRAAAPAPATLAAPESAPASGVATPLPALPFDAALAAGSPDTVRIVSQQLELMARQLELLRGLPAGSAQGIPAAPALPAAPAALANGAVTQKSAAASDEPTAKKTFGAGARIDRTATKLSPKDEAALSAFYARYIAKTKGSKRYTEEHRAVLADPRVVTGFKPMWKEIVYPLVVERSEGAHLWDIDGNDFIDVTCGFGANFLGHRPPYVVEAVNKQLGAGFEIGPQHPLAGECAKLVSALTGLPRVVFSNTGSEAVLGATRLARTISGRPLVVSFSGDYHGILDEVIVRGTKSRRSIPGAPGILPSSVENNLVLDYGDEASLELIAARAGEIAAVLVEPVQSRRPDLQPREFLKKLRELTEREGIALIFDEIITGFRLCPGGAQEYFGVRADLATYGKILGGGLPIGAIAGIPKYMDALDGGAWSYGDASVPEVGVTYFAGTFVRHPLALAACKASLTHLIERGPALQQAVNERTRRLVDELSQFMTKVGAPFELTSCSSWFKLSYPDELPFAGLIFFWLRSKGIHIWDGRVAFLTTAHTDADCEAIKRAFMESVREMQDAGLIEKAKELDPFAAPPVPGARLGKNQDGSPGWFVPDPDRPGKYLLYSPGASS